MKVAINACFGGFSLSPAATLELWKRGGITGTPVDEYFGIDKGRSASESCGKSETLARWRQYLAGDQKRDLFVTVFTPDESQVLYAGRCCDDDKRRADPILVKLIEDMGEAANGSCAQLRIVEVPDGVDWEISEYDGNEHVAQKHETWS